MDRRRLLIASALPLVLRLAPSVINSKALADSAEREREP
jgi:hypothetical protein